LVVKREPIRKWGMFCLGFCAALALSAAVWGVGSSQAYSNMIDCFSAELQFDRLGNGDASEFEAAYFLPVCARTAGYRATACRLANGRVYVTFTQQ
jgi:hypothetical protein